MGIFDRLKKQKREETTEKNQREEYIESLKMKINDIERMNEEIRLQRIRNPYMRSVKIINYGNRYEEYDGIHMHTGEILRLRKVNKIGKDGNGTYLYSAYMDTTPNEDDVEIIDRENPKGYPVCFETFKKLEDIVKDENTEEIRAILNLFAINKEYMNRDELQYIGELDSNRNVNRREKSTSSAIQIRIEDMQRKHKEKVQQQKAENNSEYQQ